MAAALVVGVGAAAPARAASLVVLLQGAAPEPLVQQSETLLAAELRAAGFAVRPRERTPGLDLREDMERAASELEPIAVLAISRVTTPGSGEIWLLDRVTGKLVIRRIEPRARPARGSAGRAGRASSATAAGDLALRAVELLRGSLMEIAAEPPPTVEEPVATVAPAPPPEVARFVAASAPGRRRYFLQGLGLGVAAAGHGAFAAGPAYAPALRLSLGGSSRGSTRLAVRLTALGLGSETDSEAREGGQLVGSARVRQDLALLEGLLAFRRDARLQPFLSAGAGVRHLRVEGTSASTLFPEQADDRTGAALVAGAGLAFRLGLRAAVTAELQLLGTAPTAEVLVAGQEVASFGPLDALLTVGLTAAL